MDLETEPNFQDNTNTGIIEFDLVLDNVCFGTWADIDQYELEQRVLCDLRKPKIKSLRMPEGLEMNLPKKADPWKNKKELAVPTCPTNTFLPRKKLPWEK